MAAKGGHIDFMFLGPPPPTRLLDPMLPVFHSQRFTQGKTEVMFLHASVILFPACNGGVPLGPEGAYTLHANTPTPEDTSKLLYS